MSREKRHLTIYAITALAGLGLFSSRAGCAKPTEPSPAPAMVTVPPQTNTPPLFSYPQITTAGSLHAASISEMRHLKTPTGSPAYPVPNPWFPIDLYQGTLTRQQFEQKLEMLYDPFSGLTPYLDINDSRVVIYSAPGDHRTPQFTLAFAPAGQPHPPMRWFRTPAEMRQVSHPIDKPLNGLRVALDPGHIGGPWAQMEERSTRYRGSAPVQEGDLNLITARLLKQELTNLGASVFVVRDSTEPVTPYRPNDMLPEARRLLADKASTSSGNVRVLPPDKQNLLFGRKLIDLAQFLFYRCSEIQERGNRIRNNFVPDITVTLYIDATPGSGRGRLTNANANIFFVHGSYTKSEMKDPGMRRHCIYKMVEGSADIESEVACDIANVFAQKTGIGPVKYGDSSTTRAIAGSPYVVARNLAANRDYDGPVVCTEPYFMNNRTVYQRLLAGDYEGKKTFDGKSYGSIFREYADCVAQGLVKAYGGSTVIANTNNASSTSGGQVK